MCPVLTLVYLLTQTSNFKMKEKSFNDLKTFLKNCFSKHIPNSKFEFAAYLKLVTHLLCDCFTEQILANVLSG